MQQRNFQAPSDWPGYRSLAIRKAWNAIELMQHDVNRYKYNKYAIYMLHV